MRRRRVLASVGGGLLVLVLAFVLWYELESHALGPEGPQVIVTVHEGESTDAVIYSLNQQHVIGSSLAFRISDFFHGTPTVLPGSYALHQNQTFSEVRALLAAGPNIYPVDVRPGLTLTEVAAQVDGLPGHAPVASRRWPPAASCTRSSRRRAPTTSRGCSAPGLPDPARGDRHHDPHRHGAPLRPATPQAAGLSTASAAALGLTPYQVITAASIVEKEGYIPVNMPDVARVIYNRLAKDTPLQMDSTVLYSLGQDGGPVTAKDLADPVALQHLPQRRADARRPSACRRPQALAAALHPPPGAWLYFVLVQKNGTEAFSDTYAEQLANEQLAKSRGLP